MALGYGYRSRVLGLSGIQAVPHREFWASLPGLVFAGVREVQSKLRKLSRREDGYDTV